MGAAEEIADFAALLSELKQRSGLSYEALAKRAHMSTSTLHRYCKGEGVPADNAVVSRIARVCRATPGELVELHRRWVLADAARERARRTAADSEPDPEPGSAERAGASTSGSGPGPRSAQARTDQPQPEAVPDTPPALAPPLAPASAPPPTSMSELGGPPESVAGPPPAATVLAGRRPAPVRTARRRWALIAASTAVVVAVSTALTIGLKGGGTDLAENGRPAGPVTSSHEPSSAASTPHPSASTSPSVRPSRSSAPAPATPGAKPSAHSTDMSGHSTGTGRARDGAEVPLTVSTRTYAWEDPQCEGKYLIDRPADEVSPPVMGQDVPGWVKAHGAVAADRQRVALTVQGTGDETVVIESLHVRVVNSSVPPAWNAYLGSSGCGGGVETRSFDTDLDAGHPTIVPKAGQRGLPYKVSQSDPEVLYITAHADAHDVNWYVELQWSSGGRQGTTRIDDHGKPFRTSGSRGRPVYEHLVGGTEWFRVGEN
ncbi:helix-turn-helix domain-containing protein [Streptomyces sp. NEAU-W12]|uniref:helix-turn-helix domain-containing protein n=1 Tax=Streptomyces sp. NEAU-W12 TaxID=2994668 RepID=UPI00224AB30C|nr:transcriptional regulator [Streptomyces sp. NEAU-W12]MCX2922352.1 helix-turn-helix domain-containing protein [Streptomyces sp. NEAU-W12]